MESSHPSRQILNICNSSPLEADVSFCFMHDAKATTFLLDPPMMLLRPGESAPLTVWAYPTKTGPHRRQSRGVYQRKPRADRV